MRGCISRGNVATLTSPFLNCQDYRHPTEFSLQSIIIWNLHCLHWPASVFFLVSCCLLLFFTSCQYALLPCAVSRNSVSHRPHDTSACVRSWSQQWWRDGVQKRSKRVSRAALKREDCGYALIKYEKNAKGVESLCEVKFHRRDESAVFDQDDSDKLVNGLTASKTT